MPLRVLYLTDLLILQFIPSTLKPVNTKSKPPSPITESDLLKWMDQVIITLYLTF